MEFIWKSQVNSGCQLSPSILGNDLVVGSFPHQVILQIFCSFFFFMCLAS